MSDRRPLAPTGTTITPLTHVRPMAITGQIISSAGSLSAQVRGMAGAGGATADVHFTAHVATTVDAGFMAGAGMVTGAVSVAT